MRVFCLCLTALLGSVHCLAGADREADTYAVYSLLLTNPQTSHGPDDNAKYLILATTVPGVPAEPCLNGRGARGERIAQILKDFEDRKNTKRKLKNKLTLSKPYELLTDSEAEQFRTRQATPEARIRFAGVTDLFSFSDVYFDDAGTLALTYISSWCGSLCALFQWKLVEKQADGSWKEVPGVGCVAVASTPARLSNTSQTSPTGAMKPARIPGSFSE